MSSERPSSISSSKHAAVDPLVGRVVHDKYKIVQLLARGGMGRVYKAEQAPLGRACAIKILAPPQSAVDPDEFRKRFFLEASIGAKLTHPNTVTIFDYGVTDDGTYFLVMEYLEGKTLARVLREGGPLDEARAAHVARQICRSLREAHALGVIHRDLKPANVYLVSHGDEHDVVKVLDFGLVKSIEGDSTEDLTQAGLFMGSPKYMAPEQIKGEPVDARTDVYALGVILYEMVTGAVPYDKPKQLDTLLAHVNEALPPLRERKPDLEIGAAVESIVLRCLMKNPADRFASMDEVLAALKAAEGGALTGTGSSALEALRATGSFSSQPTAFTASISSELPSAQTASIAPAVEAPRRSKRWLPIAAAAAALAVVGLVVVTRSGAPPPDANANAAPAAPPPAVAPVEPAAATTTAAAAAEPKPVEPPKPEPIYVEIESVPPGAKVRDEQHAILCDKTPCKVRIEGAALTVVVDGEGYTDEKVKLQPGDTKRTVKLTKSTWKPKAKPAAPAQPAATAAPTPTVFKPDPYGGSSSGPY